MGRRSILALLRSVRGCLAVVVLSTTAALLLSLMVDPVAASPGLGGAQETERYVFAYDAPNDIAMARPSRVGIIGAGAAPGLLRSPFPAAHAYGLSVSFVAPTSAVGRVDDVLAETSSATTRNIPSRIALSADEALEAGQRWVGNGYTEIGRPGSGVFLGSDGLRRFRIDPGSLAGSH